jgi:hypothetical protein
MDPRRTLDAPAPKQNVHTVQSARAISKHERARSKIELEQSLLTSRVIALD